MHALFLLLALSGDPTPETPAPAPRAVISGDETVMVGRMARLSAGESENAKSFRWIVRPKPDDMEISGERGRDLRISHGAPAVFELELIVGGADGETDVQFSELEFRSVVGQAAQAAALPQTSPTVADLAVALQQLKQLQEVMQPAMPQPAMVPPTMPAMAMVGQPPANPQGATTWPGAVKVLADRVRSGTRKAEAMIVAGSFRSVANRIKTGTFSGADPWQETQAQALEALGGAYGPWGSFFLEFNELIHGLKQQGRLPNPQASVLLLESAAEVLGSL